MEKTPKAQIAPADPTASNNNNNKAASNSPRDVVAVLTHRVLAMALEEMRSEDTRAYVSEHLVRPLLRAVVAESMPYAIAFTTVIIAILLMSALTLTLLTFSLRGK